MTKNPVKKRRSVKKSSKKSRKKVVQKQAPTVIQVAAPQEIGVNRVMIENFVSLQRVLTNLSMKLDGLTKQISKLLDLFEISAKALADKDFEVESDSKNVLNKIDNLLDQNKILARGMSLMHERIPREQFPPPIQQPALISPPQMQSQITGPKLQRSLSHEITAPNFQSPFPNPIAFQRSPSPFQPSLNTLDNSKEEGIDTPKQQEFDTPM